MPKLLPQPNPSNPPMTVGQRRAWLALEEQKRRRARVAASAAPVPAILLASDGHGRLTWTYNFVPPSDDSQPGIPYGNINIYKSADGVTWPSRHYDSSGLADGNRDCSGDPGCFRICICDWDGNDVPPCSNAVYSDGL
jgi:hypothetical protein